VLGLRFWFWLGMGLGTRLGLESVVGLGITVVGLEPWLGVGLSCLSVLGNRL
jgi:hypothetical protein